MRIYFTSTSKYMKRKSLLVRCYKINLLVGNIRCFLEIRDKRQRVLVTASSFRLMPGRRVEHLQ